MTDIWLFYYFADLAAKCPFPPILGRIFGGLTPRCSRILLKPQKAHPWPETRVLAYRTSRSVKKCDLDAWRRKQKKKERRETQRYDKSHICADHPRCATPTKVVMWGWAPNIVNHAKFHQNRYMGFGYTRRRNLPFFLCLALWLIWLVWLPPNVWYTHLIRYILHICTGADSTEYVVYLKRMQDRGWPAAARGIAAPCPYVLTYSPPPVRHPLSITPVRHTLLLHNRRVTPYYQYNNLLVRCDGNYWLAIAASSRSSRLYTREPKIRTVFNSFFIPVYVTLGMRSIYKLLSSIRSEAGIFKCVRLSRLLAFECTFNHCTFIHSFIHFIHILNITVFKYFLHKFRETAWSPCYTRAVSDFYRCCTAWQPVVGYHDTCNKVKRLS